MTKSQYKGRAAKRQKKKHPSVQKTLEIAHLGRHGAGVAHDGDARHFVPFALPGETALAMTQGEAAELISIENPSADRIEPFCPYFTRCGGCSMQHLNADTYQEWKHSVVELALENKDLDARCLTSLVDAHGKGRRRVAFHVQYQRGHIAIGFMQARTNQLLDIKSCPVLAPELDNIIDKARIIAAAFAKNSRAIDLHFTATDEGLDCNVTGTGKLDYDMHVAMAECADELDLARISVDGQTALERRKPEFKMGQARVSAPSGSFLQATTCGEYTLSDLVKEFLGDAKNIADLFCGVGPFALRMAEQASVFAADNNEAAINALKDATRYLTGLKPIKAVSRDLFTNPLITVELNEFDGVIFNPPRSGSRDQAHEIARSTVPLVVAVSCDPASFARDADIITDGQYKLEKVTPVDQFKWTSHVELVALFRHV